MNCEVALRWGGGATKKFRVGAHLYIVLITLLFRNLNEAAYGVEMATPGHLLKPASMISDDYHWWLFCDRRYECIESEVKYFYKVDLHKVCLLYACTH